MTVKCPRCRHDNPAETKFCGQCAAPLESAAVLTETMHAPRPRARDRDDLRRPLPGHRGARPRRHGPGLQGPRHRAQREGRPEAPPARSGRRRRDGRAFPQRAQVGPHGRPQERLPHVRHRPGRGRALHHHGICPRRGPQAPHPQDRTAAGRPGRVDRPADRRGPDRGPRPRHRPPRPQASEHHGRRGRRRPHHGFRHRPLAREEEHHRGRGHDRDPGIHEPGAGRGQAGRRPLRHLLARHHPLRDDDRARPVRGRHAVHDRGQAQERDAARSRAISIRSSRRTLAGSFCAAWKRTGRSVSKARASSPPSWDASNRPCRRPSASRRSSGRTPPSRSRSPSTSRRWLCRPWRGCSSSPRRSCYGSSC